MGQRLIITEEEKKNILTLYEQTNDLYKKENEFLKKYIGKTFNVYQDDKFQKLRWNPVIIKNILYNRENRFTTYTGSLNITGETMTQDVTIKLEMSFSCQLNPSRIGYEALTEYGKIYNKTLIDNINQQGISAGIQWCKKPKADFGMNNSPTDSNKIV